MEFLLILCGASLALGLFFIAADLFKLPRLATQKALLSAGRQEKKQARTTDVLLMGWAVKLAPHIHMDEYKHSRLKNTLNAAGLGMTPEEYTAFAIVKAAAVMLGVIPCLFLFPLLALVVILLAVSAAKSVPLFNKMTLSAISSTSDTMCVDKTTILCSDRLDSIFRNRILSCGSNPAVGSSSNKIIGELSRV